MKKPEAKPAPAPKPVTPEQARRYQELTWTQRNMPVGSYIDGRGVPTRPLWMD